MGTTVESDLQYFLQVHLTFPPSCTKSSNEIKTKSIKNLDLTKSIRLLDLFGRGKLEKSTFLGYLGMSLTH